MVKIRQHGSNKELYDISAFLKDIDQFFIVDRWEIQIDWCTGERSIEIEEISKNTASLSDDEFRNLYKGISQTIDGVFFFFSTGSKVGRLEAIDSSFWEIESTPEFESHMLNKYGVYEAP